MSTVGFAAYGFFKMPQKINLWNFSLDCISAGFTITEESKVYKSVISASFTHNKRTKEMSLSLILTTVFQRNVLCIARKEQTRFSIFLVNKFPNKWAPNWKLISYVSCSYKQFYFEDRYSWNRYSFISLRNIIHISNLRNVSIIYL